MGEPCVACLGAYDISLENFELQVLLGQPKECAQLSVWTYRPNID